jgi:uncharacterized protein (DUF58 family)
MKEHLLRILQATPITWGILTIEIVITAAVYAILSNNGVPQNSVIFVSLIVAMVLVLLGLPLIIRSFPRLSVESHVRYPTMWNNYVTRRTTIEVQERVINALEREIIALRHRLDDMREDNIRLQLGRGLGREDELVQTSDQKQEDSL